jgi:hypothetical protein
MAEVICLQFSLPMWRIMGLELEEWNALECFGFCLPIPIPEAIGHVLLDARELALPEMDVAREWSANSFASVWLFRPINPPIRRVYFHYSISYQYASSR